MEPEFSPQLIQFGAEAQVLEAAEPRRSEKKKQEDPQIKRYKQRLAQLETDSPWQSFYAQQLTLQYSQQRQAVLKSMFEPVYAALQGMQVQLQDKQPPDPRRFIEALQALRQSMNTNYLSQIQDESLLPLRNLGRALLMRLDALSSKNATAFAKAADLFEQNRCSLAQLQSGVMPQEYQALLQLDQSLQLGAAFVLNKNISEAAVAALLNWDETEVFHLECDAPALSFEQGHWLNRWGVGIDTLARDYLFWMRSGIRAVQQAMKQDFANQAPLVKATSHFYAALSVAPERAEAPLALAWLMVLCEQPLMALDFLEYALKLDALAEIQDLFVILRQQLVVSQQHKMA